MATIRRAKDRGKSQLGWLDSAHTFSFSHYFDPAHMGHGTLRVINDDRVAPGGGFGTHGHQDMEIISYVLEGGLEHKDSIGNGSIIRPGDVQRMSAGTGIMHSEYNHSRKEPVHFLQIWLLPDKRGHQPGYEQKNYATEEKRGKLRLVASRQGREGSVSLNQDVDMYAGLFQGSESAEMQLKQNHLGWLHVARGKVHINGTLLGEGDGIAFESGESLHVHDGEGAEILFFDMKAA